MNLTVEQFIEATNNGQIFTVEFIKRSNNEIRKMNCRRGVAKGVKGVGLKFDPSEKNLLTVYDMQAINNGADEKGAFRMVNLDSLISLRMNGSVYKWNSDTNCFIEQ
jgi:hypothetical protein